MKKIFNTIIGLGVLATLALTSCGPAPSSDPAAGTDSYIKVLASTSFLADIAQNVAGDRLKVEPLLPIGSDPHTYQPTPSDAAKIADSNVLILNGLEYEHFIESLIENAGGERLSIVATEGLEPHEMRHDDDDEHGHEDGEDHGDGADHESLSGEACEQLSGKVIEVDAGANAASATVLPGGDDAAHGHRHDRDVFNVRLHRQSDGSYGGYLFFDADAGEDYAFTSPAGNIIVNSLGGVALVSEESFELDCAGMTNGIVYPLFAGRYLVELSGFAGETVAFSAGSVHADHEDGNDHSDEEEHEDEADHAGEAESGEGHDHEAGDPHMWLDPNLVIVYVDNIRAGLITADPEGAETYNANADAYITELMALDTWIVQQVATIPAERRLLVTNHEAMGYFAERYGFEVVDTILVSFSSGASASAQEITATIEAIKDSGAPAIFLGEVENDALANQIAAETGAKVVSSLYLETLTDGAPAATYIDMMKYNVSLIVEALR